MINFLSRSIYHEALAKFLSRSIYHEALAKFLSRSFYRECSELLSRSIYHECSELLSRSIYHEALAKFLSRSSIVMIAFSIGWLDIYRYGVFYFVAFLAGYLFLYRISKKNIFWKSFPRLQTFLEKNLEDLMLALFLGVLIGGRLGHIFIYDFQYYLSHPGEIVQVRRWGMSFIGWMVGVTISLALLAWRKKLGRQEIILLFDLILAIVPFGIMIGRIGNFLNQELYGVVVSDRLPRLGYPIFSLLNDLKLFHVYPQIDSFLRLNTNFLSSFFEWFVLLLITLSIIRTRVRSKKVQPGKIVGTFLVGYSFVRFLLEYVRADSQLEFHGRFSTSQRFFLLFFLLGVAVLVFRKKVK